MSTLHKDDIRKQINEWEARYEDQKAILAEFSGDLSAPGNLIEYNLMCAQAMVLHECIADLMRLLAI